jgi:hypothetical protein
MRYLLTTFLLQPNTLEKCSLNGCKVHRITRYKQGNRTAKKIKILKTQGPKIQPEAQNTIIK